MSPNGKLFTNLYHRDLDRLINELELIPEENIWQTRPGIINSTGILVQHLVGNLRHFIGAQLGDTGYKRKREREFTNTGRPKKELIAEADELKTTIHTVLSSLAEKDFENPYPPVFPYEATVNKGLIHLYGHLNYHLGQVNYLRRMIEEKG